MARYNRPVAAITAEYCRSLSAARVAITSTRVDTVHATQNQPSRPL